MRHPLRIVQVMVNLFNSARFVVDGDSMSPTLASGDSVLAVRLQHRWNQLRRGDIVVLRNPTAGSGIFIKRIIGLPNEDLSLQDGLVYLDGVLLEEQFNDVPASSECSATRPDQIREWWTGPSEYVVLGDNRRDSQDSRRFGPLDQKLILGRVWFRYWPLRAWGRVS